MAIFCMLNKFLVEMKTTSPYWGWRCIIYYQDQAVISRLHCFMSGSSHIRSVLICVEYRNCRRTLNAYLLFAILLGQIKSRLNYLQTGQSISYKYVNQF